MNRGDRQVVDSIFMAYTLYKKEQIILHELPLYLGRYVWDE